MTPNTDTIVPQLRHKFEALMDHVSGPASASEDLDAMERYLFRELLALGGLLMHQFVRSRGAVRPAAPTAPDGTAMRYQGRRSVRYTSIFGELRVKRHYFPALGHPGVAW